MNNERIPFLQLARRIVHILVILYWSHHIQLGDLYHVYPEHQQDWDSDEDQDTMAKRTGSLCPTPCLLTPEERSFDDGSDGDASTRRTKMYKYDNDTSSQKPAEIESSHVVDLLDMNEDLGPEFVLDHERQQENDESDNKNNEKDQEQYMYDGDDGGEETNRREGSAGKSKTSAVLLQAALVTTGLKRSSEMESEAKFLSVDRPEQSTIIATKREQQYFDVYKQRRFVKFMERNLQAALVQCDTMAKVVVARDDDIRRLKAENYQLRAMNSTERFRGIGLHETIKKKNDTIETLRRCIQHETQARKGYVRTINELESKLERTQIQAKENELTLSKAHIARVEELLSEVESKTRLTEELQSQNVDYRHEKEPLIRKTRNPAATFRRCEAYGEKVQQALKATESNEDDLQQNSVLQNELFLQSGNAKHHLNEAARPFYEHIQSRPRKGEKSDLEDKTPDGWQCEGQESARELVPTSSTCIANAEVINERRDDTDFEVEIEDDHGFENDIEPKRILTIRNWTSKDEIDLHGEDDVENADSSNTSNNSSTEVDRSISTVVKDLSLGSTASISKSGSSSSSDSSSSYPMVNNILPASSTTSKHNHGSENHNDSGSDNNIISEIDDEGYVLYSASSFDNEVDEGYISGNESSHSSSSSFSLIPSPSTLLPTHSTPSPTRGRFPIN